MTLLSADPIDLLLGDDGDLDLTGGELHFSSGIDGVAQAIAIRLLLVAGEWFLDLDAGVPYYARDGVPASRALLGQKFDQARAIAIFRDELVGTPGVASVNSLTVDFDNRTRVLSVDWTVTTTFGDTVSDTLASGLS